MKQFLSNRRRDPDMNWFESSSDWEQELERVGATGWKVSSVNERFEMSTRCPSPSVPSVVFLLILTQPVPFRVLSGEVDYCLADSFIQNDTDFQCGVWEFNVDLWIVSRGM